jgi:HD-like signal output (HDOD) protein
VRTLKLVEIESSRESAASRQTAQQDTFENVPVLPETLLSFELKTCEPLVDLAEASKIILSDMGAAIQIMRLAGSENSAGSGGVMRIEDCISNLGLQRCAEAMSGRMAAWSERRAVIRSAWVHAREIAELCASLSEEMIGKNPQEACIVGLFHELGGLPHVLDWEYADQRPVDENLIGLSLARAWSLPSSVQDYYMNRHKLDDSCPWSQLVAAAHELSSRSSTSSLPKGAGSLELVKRQSTQGGVTD